MKLTEKQLRYILIALQRSYDIYDDQHPMKAELHAIYMLLMDAREVHLTGNFG